MNSQKTLAIAALTTANDVASMSSLEISELTNSRHDNVKRTIETLAANGVISLPPLVEVKIQRERRTETADAYIFTGTKGRRDSIIVVAQLCPEFTSPLHWLIDGRHWRQALHSLQWLHLPPPAHA